MTQTSALQQRLSFLNLREADLELLEELRPLLEKHAGACVAAFYRHLLSFGPTRNLLRDPEVRERLLDKQRAYLISLADPVIDEAYLDERRRIGETHERIGLDVRWYLGAYAVYLSLLTPLIWETFAHDPPRAVNTQIALQKRLLLDAEVAMETYIDRRGRELEGLADELATEGRALARDFDEQTAELFWTHERARAAEQLASIATLVAGLAHEIGTPMSVIQGHAKLLESAVSGDDAKWRLQTIQEQVGRISRIIQSLLNMARPGESRRVPVAIEPLIETTLSFVSDKLGRRGIEVARTLESVPSVSGEADRLQQVFLNLFLNAADAMPDGGELRVELRPGESGKVEIRVADTGTGIPERDLSRVCDPFFTSKEAGEGNGLGLMVSRGIIREHGGSIDVESREGEGTVFTIVLPVAGEAGSAASPDRPAS